jgi:hypothetical protein
MLHHTALEKIWYHENSTYFNFIENLGQGYILKNGYNKTVVVFCNQSVEKLFYLENNSVTFNTTYYENFKEADLAIVEVGE